LSKNSVVFLTKSKNIVPGSGNTVTASNAEF